jgi:hypothetical protein
MLEVALPAAEMNARGGCEKGCKRRLELAARTAEIVSSRGFSMRLAGFEPAAVGLEVRCSSAELQARRKQGNRWSSRLLGRGRHARPRLTDARREIEPSKVVMVAKRPDF